MKYVTSTQRPVKHFLENLRILFILYVTISLPVIHTQPVIRSMDQLFRINVYHSSTVPYLSRILVNKEKNYESRIHHLPAYAPTVSVLLFSILIHSSVLLLTEMQVF